ncbi:MAG: VanZ family protein [Candidatus Omnitrophota bacterium]
MAAVKLFLVKTLNNKRLVHGVTGMYMVFTVFMSLMPLQAPDEPQSFLKQLFFNSLHIPGYSLMTFLWVNSFKRVNAKSLAYSAMICLLFGILMEYLQSFTAYRSADFGDIVRNALGIGIVIAIYVRVSTDNCRKS